MASRDSRMHKAGHRAREDLLAGIAGNQDYTSGNNVTVIGGGYLNGLHPQEILGNSFEGVPVKVHGSGDYQKPMSTIYTGPPASTIDSAAQIRDPSVKYAPAWELSTSPGEPKYEMPDSDVEKHQPPTELHSPRPNASHSTYTNGAQFATPSTDVTDKLLSTVASTTLGHGDRTAESAGGEAGPLSPVSELDSVGMSPRAAFRFIGEGKQSSRKAWSSFEESCHFYGSNE